MRDFLVSLLLLVGVSAMAQVKNNGCYLRLIEPVQSDTLEYTNGDVRVSFDFDSGAYFVRVEVENLTDEMISLDWDKFLITGENSSHAIIFDDTRAALKDSPKGVARIAPHTHVSKKITKAENAEYPLPLYQKKYVKLRPAYIGFIIPIEKGGEAVGVKCAIQATLK